MAKIAKAPAPLHPRPTAPPPGRDRSSNQDQTREETERDEGLDKTLADSFPASDPPSTTPDPAGAETNEDPDKPHSA